MENTFEKICEKLFGEGKWEQEKKLKTLLLVTAILCVIAILGMFIDGPQNAIIEVVIIALIWSWRFIRAMATSVGRIINFFDNDLAIFIVFIILWLSLGLICGTISLVLGIIRFVQLKRE